MSADHASPPASAGREEEIRAVPLELVHRADGLLSLVAYRYRVNVIPNDVREDLIRASSELREIARRPADEARHETIARLANIAAELKEENEQQRRDIANDPRIADLRDQLASSRSESSRLREAAKDCADELEAEVRHRYGYPDIHPAMQWRYERDMESVEAVRAALSPQPKEGA